jgi:iron complex outermembrane receptor protein
MSARSPRAAFAALVSPWFVPAALCAQEPDRPDSLRRDSSAISLPDVSVLGTRQPRRPLDTPLAMTQVAPEDAFGAAGYGLDDALQLVPGVLAQSRNGGSDIRLVIRGFGARGAGDRSNAGTSRGIRILLDGIPETEPDGRTSFDGIDLASASDITVIRSNASATWGNAAGGVVSISTVPAGAAGPAASVQVGSFGLQRYVATGSAAVGRGLVYGSFAHTSFDGWREHSWSDRSLANAGAVVPLGPRTTLRGFFMGTVNGFRIPGPLTAAQVEADPRQANATYAARDERRYNRIARLGVAVEHGVGRPFGVSALLFGAPKALERSERGTYRDFNRYHIGGNIVGRASLAYTPSLHGTITAGVDEAYQDGSIRFYSLSPQGTRGGELRSDKREPANNLGAFVQHELTIGDRVTVGVGARYDVIRYSYVDWLEPHLNDARSFRRVTPKGTVNLRLGPLQSLYASVGGGVEAPAANEVDPASTFGQDTVSGINPLLEPILSTTYEIGTKQIVLPAGRGLLREVAYDVALYYTDVRNEIVPYRGGQFFFTAGRARRMGAELGVRLRTAGDVSLAGAVTWSHNTYREYVVDSVHYGRPGVTADYAGNRIVGVPDVIVGGHLAYEPGWLAPTRLQVGVQGNSRYWADDANRVPVGGFAVVSATAGLRTPLKLGAGLALGGFVTVDNLFDRRYVASAFLNPDVVNGAPVAFEPGFGRRLLVSFSLLRDDA